MATVALHTASTGLSALSTQLDITANNLANVNTVGFKSSRGNFEDLLYLEKAQPGVENANGDVRPTGLYVGIGVKVSGTQLNFTQGAAEPTGQALDLLIDGEGFFQVEIPDDIGEGIGYTRAGNFTLNADGEFVLATTDGPRLIPDITVPEDATNVTITADGRVNVDLPGQTEPTEVGVIEIATFINPAGLKQNGGNIYTPSAASGDPVVGEPAEDNRGRIMQGFLEASNVEPVKELVTLIRTQRAFELNSQSIQAADEALQTIGRLRRF
ncbi:MAG: flagellar basal-body rod protein FlgG [Planctomycetota bacterium]|jgi:flagellar basal-body rod protein FlgG